MPDGTPDSPRKQGSDKNQEIKGGGYTNIEDKNLWIKIRCESRVMKWAEIALNPVVTCASILIIIAFVVWAILRPEEASQEFSSWKAWIGKSFTWLFMGSTNIWAVFIVMVYFSKYSDIKLGKEDSVPEYNDASWFCMLFSCGVSTGLFFFGVAEPVLHYTEKNRYTSNPAMTDNELAQEAINVTLFHWGLHAWVVYTLVGLLLSLMSHREGLPMTIKSCFYPLIKDKIYGWPGDLVDILSVIATMFGVCTSLGLGVIQINEGLNLLHNGIEIGVNSQIIIIWVVTAVASISVVSGVGNGIRRISEFCFSCGMVIMMIVLFLDKTVFILNLYVQSLGYYFHQIINIGFHTDAFEQLGPSSGAEDRGRFLPEGVATTDGPARWMDWWTIFYWSWWIAWAPFVGMFIAKISAGRTIKEFIRGTMLAPVVYIFMWLIIFGGCGLRMEREAALNEICCHNINVTEIINIADNSPNSSVSLSDGLCIGEECNPCSVKFITEKIEQSMDFGMLKLEIDEVGAKQWGLTTQDRKLTRLSCRGTEQMWFDMMMSYGDLGRFLSGFSLMSLILYFVTSMDSGSLVIDCLACNGHPDPPAIQRLTWAILEGLTATALLVAGGTKVLNALQAVAIASGVIYIFLISLGCVALWRGLRVSYGDITDFGPSFNIDILDSLMADPVSEMLSSAFHKRTMRKLVLFSKFFLNIFTAPYSAARSKSLVSGSSSFLPTVISLYTFLIGFILFYALQPVVDGFWAMAWVCYIIHGFLLATIRQSVREHLSIPGGLIEDFLISLALYPAVALQMEHSLGKHSINGSQGSRNNIPNGEINPNACASELDLNGMAASKDDILKRTERGNGVSNGTPAATTVAFFTEE
jgi:choline/carnitine/betaine transport